MVAHRTFTGLRTVHSSFGKRGAISHGHSLKASKVKFELVSLSFVSIPTHGSYAIPAETKRQRDQQEETCILSVIRSVVQIFNNAPAVEIADKALACLYRSLDVGIDYSSIYLGS